MTADIETIRLFQLLFVLYIGLYAAFVTLNNITDYGTNYTFIRNVMGMHTVFPDCRLKWRAISSSTIYHGVYWVIIAIEALTALLCISGAWELWQARGASIEVFHAAKTTAFRGLGLGFTLWFAVFMIGAGQWWAAWQSKDFSGQDAAFRVYVAIGIVFVILLHSV
jgi:predicted small integral membrane protein